jgi:hypothetical protein
MTKNPLIFLSLFVVGALVMFVFDNWFALTLGLVLQIAAVVIGVFTVASPEFLSGEVDD